ncbi:winged helix DNA-binding protein [Qipengyuania sp. DSG2-2]|uniref:winged helix DNA-binding protein n=1 Tax=Qipengyuania sp. DGS2-2 TaxID=3349631 RepID=UPI0036D2F0E4
MTQADFAYHAISDGSAVSNTAAILADADAAREEWCADAEAAGLTVIRQCGLSDFSGQSLHQHIGALGDILLVDCRDAGAAALAGLARIDDAASRSGVGLVVSVSPEALEAVFACVSNCDADFLVDPTPAERIVALGQVIAHAPRARVRELSADDRTTLLRLTEQVGEIAARLESMGQAGLSPQGGAFRFESPGNAFRGQNENETSLIRKPRPSLPDPRLVREIIRQRQMRAKFFEGDFFADPAWDILLDLTAARAEHKRVSVTSLCIASGVPPTTALRWITQLIEAGLLERVQDDTDKRRAFIALTDKAAHAMAEYFAAIGAGAGNAR